MRVLVINETLDLGGAETMALGLANALNDIPGNQVAFASSDGVLLNRLAKSVRYFPIARYKLLNIITLFFEFRMIVRELNPDVIHSQGATMGIVAGIAARIFSPRTKVVVTHHAIGFTRVPVGLANCLLKFSVDGFIALSRAEYNSYMRNGFGKEKVFLIPNFIDRNSLLLQAADGNVADVRLSVGVLPRERVIIGVGRLLAAKRFDVFLTTLFECARHDPQTRILGIILGDGPERQHLQEIIDQLDLPNLRLKLLGFRNDVATYLKMADIFLFPSEHEEVLPMCLIEATALGVPVVCSDIPGNNDIVEHSRNGFLVDVKKKDYSAFVLQLLQDESLRKRFGVHGIAKAEKCYDKNKVVVDILAVYESLVSL